MAHRSRCQILAAACLLLIAPGVSLALRLPSELDALGEREREVLEAIAVRAPEQRYAALVATRHADVRKSVSNKNLAKTKVLAEK